MLIWTAVKYIRLCCKNTFLQGGWSRDVLSLGSANQLDMMAKAELDYLI